MGLDPETLDERIEKLRNGDTLTENEVRALCEKVSQPPKRNNVSGIIHPSIHADMHEWISTSTYDGNKIQKESTVPD